MPEPEKIEPQADWEHYKLWERVNNIFPALPNYFNTELVIKGINVTEIFSVGNAFATVVESQVVTILNGLRNLWDPNNDYSDYVFTRQSQTFPDVVLRHVQEDDKILFGIELKSWYVLSKEGEPTFRFQVTPDACAEADLLVVIPWILSEVISGTPKILSVYKEGAKYTALHRNWYWQQSRAAENQDAKETKSAKITQPLEDQRHPYPKSKKKSSDKAEDDSGDNFGRIARYGQLDEYLNSIKAQDYLGVKIKHWVTFFKAISETSKDEAIEQKLKALKKTIQKASADKDVEEEKIEYKNTFLEMLEKLEYLWNKNSG